MIEYKYKGLKHEDRKVGNGIKKYRGNKPLRPLHLKSGRKNNQKQLLQDIYLYVTHKETDNIPA